MSRLNRHVLLIVVAEAIVAGFLAVQRLTQPEPPQPDWALLEPATAAQLRAAGEVCESASDWRTLGELYMAAGCFPEAEGCHRVACELAPGDATFARQWAFALERLALLDEANAQYRRAIDLKHPDPDGCRYFIARNLLRAEKVSEARAVFDQGKALPANRYELARMRLRAREFTEANELLQGLLAVQPGAYQVHLLGYRLELERGDVRRAFSHADRVRYAPAKLPTPFDEEAARIVAVTQSLGSGRQWKEGRDLIEAGHLDEAEKVLREAELGGSLTVNELLAEVAFRRNRFAEGLSLLKEFQARYGPAARIVARIGDVQHTAGETVQARASWLHALQLEIGLDIKTTHQKLAASFAEAGDKALADRHLARAHYFTGRDLLHVGYTRQAIEYFEAAVKRDAKLTQAWFYLGETRRLTGQEEPALSAYRTCLQLNPDHGRALASLAFIEGDRPTPPPR